MAGARLKVEFKDKPVLDMLDQLVAKGNNVRPALLEMGEYLLQSTEQRFVDQRDPDGRPWEPLNADYRSRKKRNQHLIMVLNGYLSGSLRYQAGASSLELGTNSIYAATHQFGDDERGIPARPFLGISKADETEIIEILHDYLAP